ncbi:MAG TPA: helix-turn-helix domain-containing protein [Pyrinomonadaceae bacterium]|nr:helix-turn-helix domain-containing protein [Pyrinomonadaceae bacterium]
MPIRLDIADRQLLEMKQRGYSHARIAIALGVSKATVKRRWRRIVGGKDPEILEFARQLEIVRASAPTDYCRIELSRLINQIRTCHAASPEVKRTKIFKALLSGAREIEEIAEECRLSRSEAETHLTVLIEARLVSKRARGGALNRGRRQKFHYVPLAVN